MTYPVNNLAANPELLKRVVDKFRIRLEEIRTEEELKSFWSDAGIAENKAPPKAMALKRITEFFNEFEKKNDLTYREAVITQRKEDILEPALRWYLKQNKSADGDVYRLIADKKELMTMGFKT
jgi:hypothetical protein